MQLKKVVSLTSSIYYTNAKPALKQLLKDLFDQAPEIASTTVLYPDGVVAGASVTARRVVIRSNGHTLYH